MSLPPVPTPMKARRKRQWDDEVTTGNEVWVWFKTKIPLSKQIFEKGDGE
jgi:hypothetical protein